MVGTIDNGTIRRFETGATRDTATDKLDYEGFLAPTVLEAYARYMHANRVQSDGSLRDSDNWQKGIPQDAYMKSMWRHFMEWWTLHRAGLAVPERVLCACMFNVMGYLFEELKRQGRDSFKTLHPEEDLRDAASQIEDLLTDDDLDPEQQMVYRVDPVTGYSPDLNRKVEPGEIQFLRLGSQLTREEWNRVYGELSQNLAQHAVEPWPGEVTPDMPRPQAGPAYGASEGPGEGE